MSNCQALYSALLMAGKSHTVIVRLRLEEFLDAQGRVENDLSEAFQGPTFVAPMKSDFWESIADRGLY